MPDNNNTVVEQVEMDLDSILGTPGAEDILVPEADKTRNILSGKKESTTSFLDIKEEPKKTETAPAATTTEDPKKEEVKPDLDSVLDSDPEEVEESEDTDKVKKKSVSKHNVVGMFKSMIEKEEIIPFEDNKNLEDYDIDDWAELLSANIGEIKKTSIEEARTELFQSLPPEMQYAVAYLASGGDDYRTLFKTLSQGEEVKALDPSSPKDSEMIARQYLTSIQFGTAEEIDDEIERYKDRDELTTKAGQFKPKLDAMYQKQAQQQIAQKEAWKKQQQQAAQKYMSNVYEALKPGELAGIKIDRKTQAMLYSGLTEANYPSVSGKHNTNLLGHLLEKYQYVEPNPSLIAEALWLLSDPDNYRKKVAEKGKSAAAEETARKLKTEESKKTGPGTTVIEEETVKRKSISRENNFFRPNK